MGVGLEVADFDDIENSFAILYQPEVTWKAIDNLNLTLGVRVIDAEEKGAFSALEDLDKVYFEGVYSF